MSQLLESGLGKFGKKLPKIRNIFTHSPSIHRNQRISRKVCFLKMFSEHVGKFGPPFCEIFVKSQNIFRLQSEKKKKKFQKSFFYQSVRLKSSKAVLATFCQKKLPSTKKKAIEKFRPKSKRIKKYFKKNCFPSKCSSERVESSFDNFTETFFPKVRKKYAQSPTMYRTRKNFSRKSISSRYFLKT